jgi:hypothetical protein
MLSLDQISFYPIKNKGKDSTEPLEKTERERIAWTYCYLFDRQIAIRTGKPKPLFAGEAYGRAKNNGLEQAKLFGLADQASCLADHRQTTSLPCGLFQVSKMTLQVYCKPMLRLLKYCKTRTMS